MNLKQEYLGSKYLKHNMFILQSNIKENQINDSRWNSKIVHI